MITSPAWKTAPTAVIVSSVIWPAGTMIQALRGVSSLDANSSSELAPTAPSATSAATAAGDTS